MPTLYDFDALFPNLYVAFSPLLGLPTPLPITPSQVIFFFLISMCFLWLFWRGASSSDLGLFSLYVGISSIFCVGFSSHLRSHAKTRSLLPLQSTYLLRIVCIVCLNLVFCFLKFWLMQAWLSSVEQVVVWLYYVSVIAKG